MLTATVRALPPFVPPRPRLTLLSGRRSSPEQALRRTLAELLAHQTAPPPGPSVTPPPDNAPANDAAAVTGEDRQDQMERIAGSLEDVARLLRGRGFAALYRNEPDPFNQRLLRVIADQLGDRDAV